MTSRQRFLETMRLSRPDRVPYFEEGIRKNVIQAWRKQGLRHKSDLEKMFALDSREEVRLDVESHAEINNPATVDSPTSTVRSKPNIRRQLPKRWSSRIRGWRNRSHVLMFRTHRGFFQTMGVNDWASFHQLMRLLIDDPGFVKKYMELHGYSVANVLERAFKDVIPDAIIISEPIGGNHGPLISPSMYEEFALSNYRPFIEIARQNGVENIILRSYANTIVLIPSLLKWGINCLWACECAQDTMDYRDIRHKFGTDLRLIGGIDLNVLRTSKQAVRSEIMMKVPPLLAQGGYVPPADSRVREDVPFENYIYYRQLLENITKT